MRGLAGQGFTSRLMPGWLALAALILLALAPQAARAEEVIHSFSSQITLLANGSVDVVETISVRAEGRQIRRGIFRDIPTTLRNDDGTLLRSNLNVIDVQKDGAAENWFTESIDGGIRIYIGKSDVYLTGGDYTYRIHYTMTRMARRFEEYDELYWNATGNFWVFPIKTAVAHVILPEGARIGELQVYTGRQGDTGSDATKEIVSDNEAIFRTTRPLQAYEGMTVSVSFAKGALAPLTAWDNFLNYLSDHRRAVFPGIAAFLILLYYYFAWDAVGRDPKKGTIIPLFHPPKDMSAALVHFVHNYGWKRSGWTAFSAAIVSLATKGLVEINKDGKETSFRHTEKQVDYLPPGEQILDDYVRMKGTLKVNRANGTTILSKRDKFKSAIEGENRTVYFNHNRLYVFFGIGLSVLLVLGLVVINALDPVWLVISVAAGIAFVVVGSLIKSAAQGSWFVRLFIFIWVAVAGSNVVGTLGSFVTFGQIDAGWIAAISIIVMNAVFAFLMRAPTVLGRQVMDQIDGFKMYLETAEKSRLDFIEEPDFTIKRFEEILPYAIALGVEEKWGDRLAGELARHAIPETSSYNPYWYHGTRFSSSNLGRDIAGVTSGVSAAMIASQPVSSSSSGGGGGGFSGGGGGGGGGGGW
ncbi:MAG: DUF2207 domain-containing protein [Hyphomicrobiaceae bacterium]|nr:DUF2207 domain-containing protein [Hyphomicrobiaceae bacterium]MCC0023076.1 DUF2207 domain-containing protein [Hyphomicrobiaceae bacterium]